MAQLAKLRSLLFSALGPAIAFILLSLFAGYAVLGANGLLAWGDYSRTLAKRQQELAVLQARKAQMRNRVNLVDPRHVDPDMAEELLRKNLNVVHPNDVIIQLN
ncbi:MAG: septum formation initiator family protein [Sphingobium sp.]|nr:septum formation initiator family protein [Sphingobium sp.]